MNTSTNQLSNDTASWRRRIRRPSKRARRFLHNVMIRGMNDRAAAVSAGYAFSTASNTAQKLWRQKSIKEYFESIVREVLPPDRLARIYDELLRGEPVQVQQTKERVIGADGKAELEVVSQTRTESIDRAVQLKTLMLAIEHGGLPVSAGRKGR